MMPDHSKDPHPFYLITKRELEIINHFRIPLENWVGFDKLAAYQERYEERMTGYAVPLPDAQGTLL